MNLSTLGIFYGTFAVIALAAEKIPLVNLANSTSDIFTIDLENSTSIALRNFSIVVGEEQEGGEDPILLLLMKNHSSAYDINSIRYGERPSGGGEVNRLLAAGVSVLLFSTLIAVLLAVLKRRKERSQRASPKRRDEGADGGKLRTAASAI